MLGELGLKNIDIVERISAVVTGIQMVRSVFGNCWFDEAGCAKGIAGLGSYRKEWNKRLGVWSDVPRHDAASNAADAFRQFAQGYTELYTKGDRPRSWRDRLGVKGAQQRGSAQAA